MREPTMRRDRRIPGIALLLGLAGALPFLTLAAAIVLAPPPYNFTAEILLTGYGVAILSFMGGVHWGLAMRDGRAAQYGISVLAALYAWPALLLGTAGGWLYLAAGFLLLFGFDAWIQRQDWTAAWYLRLRLPLSLAAAGSLTVAALLR
jgi:hypothetical protein